MGKFEHKHKGRGAAAVALLLSSALVLCGCVKQKESSPTAPPPPAATATPEPTRASAENPVGAFWNTFYEDYMFVLEEMEEQTLLSIANIEEVMQMRLLMQRLQSVFQGICLIGESSENSWEGVLFGAQSGSGSVHGTAETATFSFVLDNGGRLTGELHQNMLSGKLESYQAGTIIPEEQTAEQTEGTGEQTQDHIREQIDTGSYTTVCEANLIKDELGWYASVFWDGSYTILRMSPEETYFVTGKPETVTPEQPPAAWASWSYSLEKSFTHIAIPTPDPPQNMEESDENKGAEE